MPRGRRGEASGHFSTAQAMDEYLKHRASGAHNKDAMAAAGRSLKTLDNWRRDPAFRARADQSGEKAKDEQPGDRNISFEDFCGKYLGIHLFPHQLQWIDLLERREPRDLHPSQQYRKGDPTRICVNTPPFHAKSMTITISYVVYRLCLDPELRVIIVSKTEMMAKKFLSAIKARLTHPQYARLQADYAPQGGWEETSETWSKTQIQFGAGAKEDATEKDPTVQALGIGGHIYGSRADIIVLDDPVDRSNAHQGEDQLDWINTEVDNRIEEESGFCLVVATRIRPNDLSKLLRDGDEPDLEAEDEEAGERPWTYLSQPAVLEFADDPKDWVTLWPEATVPWAAGMPETSPGFYERWSGPRLNKKRKKSAKIWALVYQQQDVSEDSTFRPAAVRDSIDGNRRVGPMVPGLRDHRAQGMDGLYVIGSLDPSGTKDTAFLAYGVDRKTGERWVLNALTMSPWTWSSVRKVIKTWTETFGIQMWVVEKNMYHASLKRDEEINSWLQARGIRLVEHYTGDSNKWDVNTGVEAMASLFGDYDEHAVKLSEPIIHIPSSVKNNGIRSLIEQLVTWQPDPPRTQKTDLVMALWFAEIKARELISPKKASRPHHVANRFSSPRQNAAHRVVNIRDYISA